MFVLSSAASSFSSSFLFFFSLSFTSIILMGFFSNLARVFCCKIMAIRKQDFTFPATFLLEPRCFRIWSFSSPLFLDLCFSFWVWSLWRKFLFEIFRCRYRQFCWLFFLLEEIRILNLSNWKRVSAIWSLLFFNSISRCWFFPFFC